jgi:hypothetical protein
VPPGGFGVKRWLIPPEEPEKAEEARADADRFLVRLSAGSGGRLLAARPDADVPEMLAQIGQELSSQLVLGYYPANGTLDGTYRRIRVTADCDGCSVRARTGYRAGVMR